MALRTVVTPAARRDHRVVRPARVRARADAAEQRHPGHARRLADDAVRGHAGRHGRRRRPRQDRVASIGSEPVTSVPSGTQITINTLGKLDFKTRAVDGEPALDSGWRTETLRIDTILPTDATTPATTAWRLAPRPPSSVSAVDLTSGVDHVEWQLDGGPTQSARRLERADHRRRPAPDRTRAVDVAGNQSPLDRPHPSASTPSSRPTRPRRRRLADRPARRQRDRHRRPLGRRGVELAPRRRRRPPPPSPRASSRSPPMASTRSRRACTDDAGNESGWSAAHGQDRHHRADQPHRRRRRRWTTGRLPREVKAADAVSGVAASSGSIDGGPWLTGPRAAQATVAGTGDHTLGTRARRRGRQHLRRPRSTTSGSTAIAPTNTTPPPGAGPQTRYTVAVTGTDAHSGVARVEWRVDGGTTQPGPRARPATITSHRRAHARDAGGRRAPATRPAWRADTVNVDMLNNDVTARPTPRRPPPPAGVRAGHVTVPATDAGSGVDHRPVAHRRPAGEDRARRRPVTSTRGRGHNRLETRATRQAATGRACARSSSRSTSRSRPTRPPSPRAGSRRAASR